MLCNILTFNAAIQDIRFFGRSFYRPVGHVAERLAALAEKLPGTGADIICLQEMFHRPMQDVLYSRLRHHYPYVCGFASRGFKLRLGNELLVLSRLPLEGTKLVRFKSAAPEELRYTSKGFLHVSVKTGNHGKLDLINFHASAGGLRDHPESDRMNAIRAGQIRQILDYAKPLDRVILAGDLNAGPHSSVDNYRQVNQAGFIDTFDDSGREGYTWDPANPLVAAGPEADLPAQRIDHIFLHAGLCETARIHDTDIVLTEACINTAGGNLPLSDHYGVLSSLQFE